MIQRIQTVFLVFGIALVAASFLLGRVWAGPAAVSLSWFTPVTLGLYSLAVVGGAISIFLFGNRDRQKQAVLLVALVTLLGLVSLLAGLVLSDALTVTSEGSAGTQTWLALAFPAVGVAFFGFARRAIAKDIELLRSVDRLR